MTQLGLKLEIAADARREELIRGIVGLLDMIMDGGDKATVTVKHERPTYRGKQQVITTTEWEVGQDAPTLVDLGLVVLQRGLFDTPNNRLVITRIPCRPGETSENTLVDLVKNPVTFAGDGTLENVDPRRAADTSAAAVAEPDDEAAPEEAAPEEAAPEEATDPAQGNLDIFRRFVDEEIDANDTNADADDDDD
jgi:hypothetical protein